MEMGDGLGEMVVDDIEHRAEVAKVEDEEDGGDDGEGEAIGGDLGSMAPEEISGDGESEGERLGMIEGEENGGDEGDAEGEGAWRFEEIGESGEAESGEGNGEGGIPEDALEGDDVWGNEKGNGEPEGNAEGFG